MKSNQYKDYIKKSFIRYAITIILVLFVLFLSFLVIDIQWVTVWKNRQSNDRLTKLIDGQYVSYEMGMETLAAYEEIHQALERQGENSLTAANRLLYDFSNSQLVKANFVLLYADGTICSTNLYQPNQEIFNESDIRRKMLENMTDQPDRMETSPSHLNYSNDQAGDFMMAKAIMEGDRLCGFLFFDMIDTKLYEALSEYPVDEVVITDRYDNLIFSIGRTTPDPMNKYPVGKYRLDWQKGSVVKLNGKHYHVHQESLPSSQLIVYTFASVEFQRGMLLYGIVFLTIIGALLLVMILALTDRVTKKNLYAIDELQKAVVHMGQGNMDYHLQGQVFDEFQVLHDAYRHMVLQREELMLHNNELAERKRIMEIKQLEEQFNPHFIFNVMETLRYEIVIDAGKASDMLLAFANLMRYSIYYGDMIVPLQTDIEYINDYLLLQKMRYNKRLQYHIDIPEELFDCQIPKLLLQPVVENCLNHGMKNTRAIGISIAGKRNGNLLELTVEDDGSGMEEEKLNEIRAGLEQEDGYKGHIGLYNSHRVVRLLYGQEYGMTIQSGQGQGTKVTITLPVSMEVEDV